MTINWSWSWSSWSSRDDHHQLDDHHHHFHLQHHLWAHTYKDSHRCCLDKDIVLDFRKTQLSLRKLFLEKIKTKSMDYHVSNNTVQYNNPTFANCPTSWLICMIFQTSQSVAKRTDKSDKSIVFANNTNHLDGLSYCTVHDKNLSLQSDSRPFAKRIVMRDIFFFKTPCILQQGFETCP